MKNSAKHSNLKNQSSFASFSKVQLSKAQQKHVKGGDDEVIIIVDVVEG